VHRARWTLNRVAAAIVGAVLVGIVAAVILTIVEALTCGPTCTEIVGHDNVSRCIAYGSTCGDIRGALLFNLIYAPIFSVVLGVVPGIVALTATPAKKHPWRSLPSLIIGTLSGFLIWLPLARNVEWTAIVWLASLFVIPSATGFITAWNIDRLPPTFRLAARRG
jgi:hypothetical protein